MDARLCSLQQELCDKGTASLLIKQVLRKRSVKLSLLHPAVLCLLLNGAGHGYRTPKKSARLGLRSTERALSSGAAARWLLRVTCGDNHTTTTQRHPPLAPRAVPRGQQRGLGWERRYWLKEPLVMDYTALGNLQDPAQDEG